MRLLPLVLLLLASGCFSSAAVEPVRPEAPVTAPASFDHGAFSALLGRVVTAEGGVDYAALAADPAPLAAYLRRLAATDPSRLPDPDRLAFWLNAYNAYTLHLIAEHYPIGSIHDVVSGPFVPGVNSPFGVRFATVGGEARTLDEIEHDEIRGGFAEPRIHFALVCAARSCPPLRREAYDGARLDAQLDDQARTFLADPAKNRFENDTAALSKIFDWFRGDFGGSDEAVQRFLAPFVAGEAGNRLARAGYHVRHLPYDWSLNDAR